MSSHAVPPDSDVLIAGIIISFDKPRRSLASADVLIDNVQQVMQWTQDDKVMRVVFPSPLHLSISQVLKLQVHYRRFRVSNGTKDFVISAKQLTGLREWRGQVNEMDVVITLGASALSQLTRGPGPTEPAESAQLSKDNLVSTTEDILAICPRFRVLVIGRTGAGKSTIINTTFGTTEAVEKCHVQAGVSDINTEIICQANNQFVLHDSKGFEGGDVDNLRIVQDFLKSRDKHADIKEQVHAVWLCLPIPIAGGRILETGIEEFLDLKTAGKLGKLPVIAIFTKYDQLVVRADREMESSVRAKMDKDQLYTRVRKDADAALSELVSSFKKYTKKKIPHIAVSTKKGYEGTLQDLVQLTTNMVREHVTEEASLVSAIAQRVNPNTKIEASIAIGKRKYWRGLALSVCFRGNTMDACLKVIRGDILVVWSIPDPSNLLASSEFQAVMLNLVDTSESIATDLPPSLITSVARQFSYLVGEQEQITQLVLKFAEWVDGAYQQTLDVLLRLMAYLVDLTLVMQLLFSAIANAHPVSRRLIKLTANAYKQSKTKKHVHLAIENYVHGMKPSGTESDGALDIVEGLIKQYSRVPEMDALKNSILSNEFPVDDEQWDGDGAGLEPQS